MPHDWSRLCTEDAARVIMLAALAQETEKIHIARDSEGATIFFMNGLDMRCYDRLPPEVDEQICAFFIQLGGIEPMGREALSGYGLYVLGGMDVTLVVNAMLGTQGYDVVIIPEIFHR